MYTFGVLGLSCEAPAAPKPPGFHTTAREPKRAHLSAPALQTPKFHEKTPREGGKERILWREGKKREILGPPPFWAPPFWAPPFEAPFFQVWAPALGSSTLRGLTVRAPPSADSLA